MHNKLAIAQPTAELRGHDVPEQWGVLPTMMLDLLWAERSAVKNSAHPVIKPKIILSIQDISFSITEWNERFHWTKLDHVM